MKIKGGVIMGNKFKRYVGVQYGGMYNMITEANNAMELAELTSNDYWYIIEHYSELVKEYPSEYEEGKRIGQKMSRMIWGE